ncbi:hypothetical protein Daura_15440 [Dactylosporangium aurantiacum]|uniref:Uncharacterized protein n=1 Tax=Dactylosporangium aurantiacum TaxID=35754 RepID=A0A9Q9IJS0_9ACTN|nr:hypothetical protein [Dactylosporangium aurantiacum]MDG6107800.1 hypothetical protein [Dactylosporangium aurantiacum]UWZ57422.1 hypothetical protein Daura_15440 [Dactylosporangium aurantiacum]
MTSLTAPAAARPRRAGTVYLTIMASLVLAWFATVLLWDGDPSTHRTTGTTLMFLMPLVLLAVAQAWYWWLRTRSRPVALDVRDGAFIAPADNRLLSAFAVTALAGIAMPSGSLLLLASPDMPRSTSVLGWVGAGCALALFLMSSRAFVRGAGQIEVRPEGLRMTYAYGRRDVPWEAVAAGPLRRETLWDPGMRIGRPDLVRSTGLAVRRPRRVFLPVSWSHVRREFLADAVNYYLATPAARPTIGTAGGYVHLRRVLGTD